MKLFKKPKKKGKVTLTTKKDNLVYDIPIAARAHDRKNEFYFTICSVMKNEGPYLEEWIEFHRLVGCEHFILYDNDSTDNTAEVLQRYIASNIVTLIPWPGFCPIFSLQMLAYSHALSLMAGRTFWLCFIDIDEFLFPTETDDLRTALVEFENEPAVAVYWSMFGTSGHKSKPQGLVIKNYTWRMPYPTERSTAPNHERLRKNISFDAKTKSIVQPTRVTATIGAHTFKTDRFPVLAVDGSWHEIRHHEERNFTVSKFQLNHYISKSEEERNTRVERGDVEGFVKREKKKQIFHAIETDPVRDIEILKYLPSLKTNLTNRRRGSA